MGALFAQMLFERKFRGLRPLDRKPLEESIGSLLTRIFMHHGIDLSDTPCVDTIDRFDAQFFLNTKILHSASKRRRGSSSSGPAHTHNVRMTPSRISQSIILQTLPWSICYHHILVSLILEHHH
ncbi:unnamed protein product [Brassica oleracea var. botrytis]